MYFNGNLHLLHQLALEYNTLISTAVLGYSPNDLNQIFEEDEDTDSSILDDDDDIDEQLADIENEMIVLMAFKSKKRNVDRTSSAPKQKKMKYNTQKLFFTNPITMERQEFTYEFSIWYCNYITDPSPESPKWSKRFRRHFRMTYELFLDLSAQCNVSEYFERWCSSKEYNLYNKKKVYSLKLLILCALRYLGRSWTNDDLEEATVQNIMNQ